MFYVSKGILMVSLGSFRDCLHISDVYIVQHKHFNLVLYVFFWRYTEGGEQNVFGDLLGLLSL